MKIEAVRSFRIKLSDREMTLHPGQPVDLPPRQARKVLRNCKGKVRLVVNAESDWQTLWQHVAEVLDGLSTEDRRWIKVRAGLEMCDESFSKGNKVNFWDAVTAVTEAMTEPQ